MTHRVPGQVRVSRVPHFADPLHGARQLVGPAHLHVFLVPAQGVVGQAEAVLQDLVDDGLVEAVLDRVPGLVGDLVR